MKGLLRIFLFHLVALWLIQEWIEGLTISGGLATYLFAAFILSLLNLLLKPILKLLFFPVNALTLGFFSLVINAGVFFLFLKLVPEVSISAWRFPGLEILGVHIPPLDIPFIGVLLIVSLGVSIITNLFTYLVK